MKALPSIRGATLRDQIRSSEIQENLNIQDIVRFARARRRHCREHVDRMGGDR